MHGLLENWIASIETRYDMESLWINASSRNHCAFL